MTFFCVSHCSARKKIIILNHIITLVTGLIVKVTVLHQGRRIKKKRTENVRLSTCPSWNEAIALPLPASQLADISITVDVCKDRLSGSEVFMYLYYLL